MHSTSLAWAYGAAGRLRMLSSAYAATGTCQDRTCAPQLPGDLERIKLTNVLVAQLGAARVVAGPLGHVQRLVKWLKPVLPRQLAAGALRPADTAPGAGEMYVSLQLLQALLRLQHQQHSLLYNCGQHCCRHRRCLCAPPCGGLEARRRYASLRC